MLIICLLLWDLV